MDIKKILIRFKSRKFLTTECTICLCPVTNDSICRMLNCFHIYHSECIQTWFVDNASCPNCKKKFGRGVSNRYELDDLVRTINVDNECFYSEHLVRSEFKLASTRSIIKNDPFFLKMKHQRVQSFDLAKFMRKDDYMLELRKDETKQGPLKIIKLPTSTQQIFLQGATPKTLLDLGFHQSHKKLVDLDLPAKTL